MTIIAGTGHRPDKIGAPRETLIAFARQQLARRDVTKVISGMALGWDTALAEAAVELHVPFVAAIPFDGHHEKWPPFDRAMFKVLRGQAAEVVVVCEGGYEPWKYQRRNEWMTDRCDALLALWNGSGGGTANCIRYADKVKRRVVNVWDAWESYVASLDNVSDTR